MEKLIFFCEDYFASFNKRVQEIAWNPYWHFVTFPSSEIWKCCSLLQSSCPSQDSEYSCGLLSKPLQHWWCKTLVEKYLPGFYNRHRADVFSMVRILNDAWCPCRISWMYLLLHVCGKRQIHKTQQCKVLLGFDYVLILLCIIIAGIFQSPRMVLRYLILYLSMYNYM